MGIVTNLGTVPNIWTTEYLGELASEAEVKISSEVPCIYVRFPLNITAGTAIYDLSALSPSQYLTGIIRISYQGWTVWPIFTSEMRNNFIPFHPGEGDVQSRPFLYLTDGYGLPKIRLYPSPSQTITYDNSDLSISTNIRNNVVVSGWRIADQLNGYRIPEHLRFSLVRHYVLARAFKKEGKGQNLDASKYHEGRFTILLARFKHINNKLFVSRCNYTRDGFVRPFGYRPPRPVLPPNFPQSRW